jgi:uncharacterized protein involved in exopolysaccharide biosynthesis
MTMTPSEPTGAGPPETKVFYVLQETQSADTQYPTDLGRLVGVAWQRKWWIAGFTLLLTGLAVAYALMATEWFRAEAVLLPRERTSGSGLSSGLAQFGGLASLAGINLGQDGKQEPLGVLRSRGFAHRFIEKNGLADILSRELSSRLQADDGHGAPDVRKIVDQFVRQVLFVAEDKKTGLVTIAVEWTDAQTAADWANRLTWQVNDEMRLRALDDANRNIAYLQGQLATTEAVSLQQAIARLLETELQKVMMAQGTDEYAFRVIDEARPPARRARPKRMIITVLALVSGLFMSTIAALLINPPVSPVTIAAKGARDHVD